MGLGSSLLLAPEDGSLGLLGVEWKTLVGDVVAEMVADLTQYRAEVTVGLAASQVLAALDSGDLMARDLRPSLRPRLAQGKAGRSWSPDLLAVRRWARLRLRARALSFMVGKGVGVKR